MSESEFISEIDRVLGTMPMSQEMREFLTALRDNPPVAEQERVQAYLEWMELILITMQVVSELSKYF
ncbi:hypothetical protein [Flavobacterium sp.]|uniref:hypothetical protein n=1 Tax=Flavobacterium sp. TaxID=239 RepID=UPI00121C0515|nr:hypothetical protein [Flavobacterium sp.]RZJ71724.1 MAG: hypothetical protein EOO49_08655 [Flavobacterium sp.]